ncbi:hypothetical protein, partial [Porphyromonas gingivalis]|uniref:hypothetical protein n=1 Tax=Porphyromonas gingivalis TaxID=837 RepID=UPI00118176E7
GSGVLWTNIPCSADSDLAGLVTPIFFENGEVTISIPLKRSVCTQKSIANIPLLFHREKRFQLHIKHGVNLIYEFGLAFTCP